MTGLLFRCLAASFLEGVVSALTAFHEAGLLTYRHCSRAAFPEHYRLQWLFTLFTARKAYEKGLDGNAGLQQRDCPGFSPGSLLSPFGRHMPWFLVCAAKLQQNFVTAKSAAAHFRATASNCQSLEEADSMKVYRNCRKSPRSRDAPWSVRRIN